MTAADFDAVLPFLKISSERIAAARASLVDGHTLKAIGDANSWSPQAVGDAVDKVWDKYQKYLESQRSATSAGTLLPPGWEQVTLIAPSSLIARFRAEIALEASLPQRPLAKPPASRVVKAKPKRARPR